MSAHVINVRRQIWILGLERVGPYAIALQSSNNKFMIRKNLIGQEVLSAKPMKKSLVRFSTRVFKCLSFVFAAKQTKFEAFGRHIKDSYS